MTPRRIALVTLLTLPLAACAGGMANPFGASTVRPEVASSHPDGSLAPGHGRPHSSGTWWRSGPEKEAESLMIERDTPYGVAAGN